ncbi:futalosine nucleosidase [Syntrophobotulus glycolicus DSM 8271]|uniref:Futalosine hydrolase n=1 Tax=Syntrophobotulus glycolicus (strain DSM 8271 / FlGlyR) TaxID=645991 RepID=F0T1L2_SYNGF|nr:futalosine hydrolase [Syntrophobotulus glycolicus]ADY57436.1 futalosine nucleosidase [Syntrophobotulus glycolicus DSM 8271]
MDSGNKRVLIVAAVAVEKEAVLRGLRQNSGPYDVLAAGVGPVAAAAQTAKQLASGQYQLVISTGIAGGFAGRAEMGSIVVSEAIIAADLGVNTQEGFCSLAELGYGPVRVQTPAGLAKKVTDKLRQAGLEVCSGPVLTVTTATGTAEGEAELSRRVPGAAAEAMEGYGAAWAASLFGLPSLEIRAISNQVGPRDSGRWRIKEALTVLEKAYLVLAEEL